MPMNFDLVSYLKERQVLINDSLEKYLPLKEDLTRGLLKAMRYSLFAGGKRLRPILCLAAVETVGGDMELSLPIACALEMIHTYSLIHDDLPAMDNDDLRRGKPTNHKVFGEATALLAGDGLLTEAFFVMSNQGINSMVTPQRLLRIIQLVADAASCRGMAGGQIVDLESEGKEISFPVLEFIHAHKTGALITASLEAGAVAAGADSAARDAFVAYGRHFGLAFQITDDILDVIGDSKVMGKPAGSDEEKGKSTFPALFGLDRAKEMASQHVKEALVSLECFDQKADPLRALVRYLLERRK